MVRWELHVTLDIKHHRLMYLCALQNFVFITKYTNILFVGDIYVMDRLEIWDISSHNIDSIRC